MHGLNPADWINIAIATAAFVSAGVAAVTTYATFRILRANQAVVDEMRAESIARERPYIRITLHVRPQTQLFYLVIENIGKSPAFSIRLTLERPFRTPTGNLADLAAFSQVIDCLPSNSVLRFMLGTGPELLGNDVNREEVPLRFDLVATYSYGGSSTSERTTIDFRPYHSSSLEFDPVVEELERLRDTVKGRLDALVSAIGGVARRA